MNRNKIYNEIADQMLLQPLSVFRTKPEAVKFVKFIIRRFKDEELKQKIIDNPL